MSNALRTALQRRRMTIQGIVQGVGFRPFVYGQAHAHGLTGFVLNDCSGVSIEVQGDACSLDAFQQMLVEHAPPLARIDMVAVATIPVNDESGFVILQSQDKNEASRHALISPDIAPCQQCLQELFDLRDRRFHYPFINCTNCGPRFTIVQDVPYDREKTTMSVFPMCPACLEEYENPFHRRFHAQPNACPVCGPHVQAIDQRGLPIMDGEVISWAASELSRGKILAIKGLGGYHLACDALNVSAVRHLRERKQREAKPFALMVADLETARHLCEVNEEEAALLEARSRPIVLLEQRSRRVVAPDVAPSHTTLGIMLPYTPLHYLLLDACRDWFKPDQPVVLVMTSGNLSDEPIAYEDEDAQERLLPLADGMLIHNRPIHMRCDDSVLRSTTSGTQFLRRSRGYAPESIPLNIAFPVPVLACGAHLKNTFCLGKEKQAFISQHIGDLENLETLLSFQQGIAHYERLFDISPRAIAYDLHPDYLATKYALDSDIVQKIGVQHHHAHIASVLAEHGLQGPVIGVAADGTGYGTDGAIWGCEIMVADLLGFERVAHLDYVTLPGGEQAVRQPWRVAAAYLAKTYDDAFLDLPIPFVCQLDRATWHVLSQMIARNINSPLTSSLGRLFDAVAALLGLRQSVLYEGQAAIELEVLATTWSKQVTSYPYTLEDGSGRLNALPLIEALVNDIAQGISIAYIARRFHQTIAEMLASACLRAREQSGLERVALSGGVFQNRLLLEELVRRLQAAKFQVYLNRLVPPNDGGLSLGQAAVAAARLAQ